MAPAVKVYRGVVSPLVARPLLCLEEASVDYELVPMSRKAGDHRKPEFLARNPFGQVPILQNGDLTLFESRAIARHVLRKQKSKLLGSGSPQSAAMVGVWLEVEAHQQHPATATIFVQCIVSPLLGGARDQAVVDENITWLRKVLEVYKARLSASTYLAGDDISLTDLSHFLIIRYFMEMEYVSLVDELPHVNAWWEGLKARPAASKVVDFMPPDLGLGKKAEQ